MIFDPLHQLQLHFGSSIKCLKCESYLKSWQWKCGQSNALQPRILHDITHAVLLVSAVYMCDNGHEVPSTDPNILQMIYPETHLPFVLLHRTGFTRGFLHIVIQLFVQGLPLSVIESFVSECRLNHCQSKLLCLKNELELCGYTSNVTLECKAINLLHLPSPSNDILNKCFLTHFQQCKTAYEQAMSSLTTKSYISFDHTFKVASNIGYQRFDGHWINKYSSVFCIFRSQWVRTSTDMAIYK